jgi:hypothetical protein
VSEQARVGPVVPVFLLGPGWWVPPSLVDVENPESFVITDATGRRSRVSCFEDEAGFIDLPQGSREDVAIDELRADVDGSRTTPEG